MFRIAIVVGLVVGLVAAPSAGASQLVRTSPGRELIAVSGGATVAGMGFAGATDAVALPDGDVIAVGGPSVMTGGEGFYLADITHTGALNPAFGDGGIAHIAVAQPVVATQVLRRPDGRLLVIADAGPGASTAPESNAMVFGLEPDGSLDPSWGADGVVTLDASSAIAALDSAGDVVVSEVALTNTTHASTVQRLTAAGAPDPTFGTGGTTTLQPPTSGTTTDPPGITVGPNGRIYLVAPPGATAEPPRLVVLRPDGTIDPTFADEPLVAPAAVLGSTPLVENSGIVAVASGGMVARFTPAGDPITVYGQSPGSQTEAPIGLFANQDGSLTATYTPGIGGTIIPWTVSAANVAHVLPRIHAIDPGGQNISITAVVRRTDGSYLAVGGASRVVSGDGGITENGTTAFDFVALALTPALAVDPTFGGPATPITAHLQIGDQTAKQAHHAHAIHVTAWTSTFAQTNLTIRAHGRVIARIVSPLTAGTHTGNAPLTAFGRGYLATHHNVRVTATLTIDDVLTRTATTTATTTLR